MEPAATHSGVSQQAGVRDQYADLLRVAAVLMVVLGHWAVTTVFWDVGGVDGENALSHIDALAIVTWVFQVMPLLFFVGGFSNARSLASRDGVYLDFLQDRLGRLLRPTFVFFGVWLAIGLVLDLVDPSEPNVLVEAAEVAAIPVWFIGLYLAVVALAPAMLRLHRRYGIGVPVALGVGAVVVDLLQFPAGLDEVGVVNYALVWLFGHQLGFFYADGRLQAASMRVAGWMAAVGLGALILLTTVLDYPVSMVGVPGDARWNTEPPSLPIVALTLWLVGLAMLLRPMLSRVVANRPKRLRRLNGRVLTIYLWHVSALPLAVLLLYPPGFPQPAIGTRSWWAWRPLWVAALALGLYLLVSIFGRFEVHPRRRAPGTPASPTQLVVVALAVFSLSAGVLGFGVTGFTDITGVGETLLVFDLNPLQNVVHLVIGAGLAAALHHPSAVWLGTAAAGVYVGLGLIGIWTGLEALALNQAGGVLHLVVGLVAAGLLAVTPTRQLARV